MGRAPGNSLLSFKALDAIQARTLVVFLPFDIIFVQDHLNLECHIHTSPGEPSRQLNPAMAAKTTGSSMTFIKAELDEN
jgi:hypothetical protein